VLGPHLGSRLGYSLPYCLGAICRVVSLIACVYTPDELRRLLEACPEWLRPIAGLAVVPGLEFRYPDVSKEKALTDESL
jgi:hypothetical protein